MQSRSPSRFPDPESATEDGFVAWGGDLEPETLLDAYTHGIFPCFDQTTPILWWSPNPRGVLLLKDFAISSRSSRKIRQMNFEVTFNYCFPEIIRACAPARSSKNGVWITPEMIKAYERMHALGWAHSVETWQNGRLAGGLYGIAIGKAFFGESMFHNISEASRAALVALVQFLLARDFHFLDCQDASPHMLRMGARAMPRWEYLKLLETALA